MTVFNKNFFHMAITFIGIILVGVVGMLSAAYFELREYRAQVSVEQAVAVDRNDEIR